MINQKRMILCGLLCLNLFIIQHIYGQNDYNPKALAFFKSSLANLVQGEYEKAIADCNQVLRIDPDSSVTYTVRARAYFEIGDMDKVIADCTKAISNDRNNLSAFNIRASAYGRKGDYDRAVKDWQAVLRIDSTLVEAMENIEKVKKLRGY